MYSTSVRIQKRKKRPLLFIGTCIVLLIAGCGVLFNMPAVVQDISSIAHLVVGKFSHSPVTVVDASEDDALRGNIYDRDFTELSVSYQLYSLFVHPAKINPDALSRLTEVTGVEADTFEAMIQQSSRVVELVDDLDGEQLQAIEQLQLDGVYCTSSEQRFYPEHTAASHVLGYTGEGIGLAGVESKYDVVLRPGEYLPADAPTVDFKGNKVLGRKGTDLVLTLDIELQKAIDRKLYDLLRRPGVSGAMALLMEPATGRVLALSSQPTFDPNYFWKAGNVNRQNRLYVPEFDLQLVRPLLLRAAARIRDGEQFTPLLPQNIAARDYGLSESEFSEIVNDIGFLQPVAEVLPSGMRQEENASGDRSENLSLMQLGVGLSSLVNGGWRITPSFLDSVYDRESGQRFVPAADAVARTHVFTPAMGVIVRRELLVDSTLVRQEKALTLAEKSTRVVSSGALSMYVQQQLFVGMVPKKKPTMVLVMAIEQDTIAPLPRQGEKIGFAEAGKTLLDTLYSKSLSEQVAEYPRQKDQDNLARFLISRRVKYTPAVDAVCSDSIAMPQLLGMSLRKGLQQLNQHNIRVTVTGSGQIVAQSPAPGQLLNNVDVCSLTLESEI